MTVNRNSKYQNANNDKNKNCRFDIALKTSNSSQPTMIELRTTNSVECSQWIQFLSSQKKNHRKSIRTGLESVALQQLRDRQRSRQRSGARYKSTDTDTSGSTTDTSDETMQIKKATKQEIVEKEEPINKAPVRRFKRQKTSRSVTDKQQVAIKDDDSKDREDDEFDENYEREKDPENPEVKGKVARSHSRKLSINSWAVGIQNRHDSIASQEQDRWSEDTQPKLNFEPVSFEGFLIRKIGKESQIGEKIYVRLDNDTLEFSKIEQTIENEKEIIKYHNANIMGTVGVEHIKNVKMVSESETEFVIVFNEYDSCTDWTLTVPKSSESDSEQRADKWVKILQRAQKEAKAVEKTIINETTNIDNAYGENIETIDNEKRKKKRGALQTLSKMINDETIQELEMARSIEMKNAKNLDSFDVQLNHNGVNGTNYNQINVQKTNKFSCLCFK